MEVRPATFADVTELTRGMKVVVDEGHWIATEAGTPLEELAKRTRRRLAEAPVNLVLVDAETIVGVADLGATRVDGVLSLGMGVAPSHRGRGGGRMLIEAAIAARPEDVHKIELEVWPDNEAAIALYEATGFEREGLRRDHYRRRDGTLRSALIMAHLFE
jgi:ribosomal protein S18 acetylase RimI-like enzyme